MRKFLFNNMLEGVFYVTFLFLAPIIPVLFQLYDKDDMLYISFLVSLMVLFSEYVKIYQEKEIVKRLFREVIIITITTCVGVVSVVFRYYWLVRDAGNIINMEKRLNYNWVDFILLLVILIPFVAIAVYELYLSIADEYIKKNDGYIVDTEMVLDEGVHRIVKGGIYV